MTPEDCRNGRDDDGDTLIDCADPDCVGNPACGGENCNNMLDDDGDGFIDCADSECITDPICASSDYDGDTHANSVDCAPADSQVWVAPAEVPRTMKLTKPIGTVDAMLAWTLLDVQAGPGTRYDVVSGRIRQMWTDRSVAGAACLANDGAGATTTDARDPAAESDGFYYIVRGDNTCGRGTYGTTSLGAPRTVGGGDCP